MILYDTMDDFIGVAISTTGHEHRLDLLRRCVDSWLDVLPLGSCIIITVDGDEQAVARVNAALDQRRAGAVLRVGQPLEGKAPFDGHMGVAVSKNTGIEYLMSAGVEHLFLCDDDTWPLSYSSLKAHTQSGLAHSLVCWGKSRLTKLHKKPLLYAEWNWPRGVVLHATRSVIEKVGGMAEAFGPGGHEHVEWSNRIFNAGLTPCHYPTPVQYSTMGAKGASVYWHAEDMRRGDETLSAHAARKKALTSIRRAEGWAPIEAEMKRRAGDTAFVSYTAAQNGRASATMS